MNDHEGDWMELKADLEKMVDRWVRKIDAYQASKDPEIVGRRLGFAEAATELKARLTAFAANEN